MEPSKPLYVLTILYNSEEALPAFIESLKAQRLQDWRLIAVDNASKDRSVQICRDARDDRITVIENSENLGFSMAANQAFRAADKEGGDFFILFNNDTVFDSDFLEKFLEKRSSLGARVIAPRIMNRDAPDTAWYAGGHLEYRWIFRNVHELDWKDAEKSQPRIVDFASGCCLGIEKSVLQEVGLFDESFFVYWEDTDLCLRLKEKGMPIFYVGDVSIFHIGGASSGGEFTESYNKLLYRSHIQLLRKHFGIKYAVACTLRLMRQQIRNHGLKPGVILNRGKDMLEGLIAPQHSIPRL